MWAYAGLPSTLRSDSGTALSWASDGDICVAGALLGKPFVAKLTAATAALQWLQIVSDPSDATRATGTASAVLEDSQGDGSGGCVLSGTYSGTVNFDTGAAALRFSSDGNSEDLFFAEFQGSDGTVVSVCVVYTQCVCARVRVCVCSLCVFLL